MFFTSACNTHFLLVVVGQMVANNGLAHLMLDIHGPKTIVTLMLSKITIFGGTKINDPKVP